jgi:hypothetical protein
MESDAIFLKILESELRGAEIQGQAGSKTLVFENLSGAYLKCLSTGSAGNHRLQAGLT